MSNGYYIYTLNTTENTLFSFSSWGLGFAGGVLVGWDHKLANSTSLFTLTTKTFKAKFEIHLCQCEQNLMPCLWGTGLSALWYMRGFPDSSVGKESAYNAGDPSSIPGSGKSTGEGMGYPLQYSWAFFLAQLVKNPPAMWETWFQSLGWEDLLEKGKAIHSRRRLPTGLENTMDCIVHQVEKS